MSVVFSFFLRKKLFIFKLTLLINKFTGNEAKCQSLVEDSFKFNDVKIEKINLDDSLKEPSFPWKKFFIDYVYPEIYKLGFAIIVSKSFFNKYHFFVS